MAHGGSLVGQHSTSLRACVCACAGPWADVHPWALGGRGGFMLSTKQGYVRHTPYVRRTVVDIVSSDLPGGPPWGPEWSSTWGSRRGVIRNQGSVGLGGAVGQLSNAAASGMRRLKYVTVWALASLSVSCKNAAASP